MEPGEESRTVAVERPDGYSDEEWAAYRAGGAAMMQFCGRMLLSMGADIESQLEDVPETQPAEDDEDEDDPPEKCPECGRKLVYQMGEPEGECPNCDLLGDNSQP